MKIATSQGERGFVTLVILILLTIMLLLITINNLAVIRLRREVKEVEKRQIERVTASTNQPATGGPMSR
jgi:Tfp pilus assembly protein PilX